MKPCDPDPCGPDRKKARSLPEMVQLYIKCKRPKAQKELESFHKSPFEEALGRAALAEHEDGERLGHQRRLRPETLRRARNVLLDAAKELSERDSFDALHDRVKELLNGIRGLGELYYYDTALRVAGPARMPMRVYLHQGTREGARALGLDWHADSLDPRALPRQLAVLEPHEMEDFLCIFKSRLTPKMGRPAQQRDDV